MLAECGFRNVERSRELSKRYIILLEMVITSFPSYMFVCVDRVAPEIRCSIHIPLSLDVTHEIPLAWLVWGCTSDIELSHTK